MTTIHEAQHTLPVTENDEPYTIVLNQCDMSTVSSLPCSVASCRIKRTRKAMDFSRFHQCDEDGSKKRRRRGASYTIVEIHSLLHLMKRVLPRSADEWELIRIVHGRIFPDNDRTVSSLKKKFKDLCREASTGANAQQLDERFRAKPAFSRIEVEKAREVQRLISEKPQGFKLVLSKSPRDDNDKEAKSYPNSLPKFTVQVPDPLQPHLTSSTQPPEHVYVPKYIQIPESPATTADHGTDDDEMSALDLDDQENDDFGETESVIGNPSPPPHKSLQEAQSYRGTMITPCVDMSADKKLPAIIIDSK